MGVLHHLSWYLRRLASAVADTIAWLLEHIGISYRREWRYLYHGLPALIAAVTCLGMLFSASSMSGETLRQRYSEAALFALRNSDFHEAEICLTRLVELDDHSEGSRFQLALTLEKKSRDLLRRADQTRIEAQTKETAEQIEKSEQLQSQGQELRTRTVALMKGLAPSTRPGYPRAHVWLANYFLAAGAPHDIQLAERHFRHALAADPSLGRAHLGLAKIYIDRKQYRQAEEHLLAVTRYDTDVHMLLAQLYRALGEAEKSQREAAIAVKVFQKAVRENPGDYRRRIGLVDALLMLGNHEAAVNILREGMDYSAAQAESAEHEQLRAYFRHRIAEVLVRLVDKLEIEEPDAIERRTVLLVAAVKADPSLRPALRKVLAISKMDGPSAKKARNAILELMAEGKATATAHLVIGTDHWLRGEEGKAQKHLELACQLNPQLADAMNNLAWVLAHQQDADLERALKLSELALSQAPAHPFYRGTRGHVLMQLGRYDEAVSDLTFALRENPDDVNLHVTLAQVYEKLDLELLAEKHRQRVKLLQKDGDAVRPNEGELEKKK